MARVLEDWDPVQITGIIDRGIERKRILEAWAQQTEPPESFRWTTTADQNWLSDAPDAQGIKGSHRAGKQ
jgi:hypothetical protein